MERDKYTKNRSMSRSYTYADRDITTNEYIKFYDLFER